MSHPRSVEAILLDGVKNLPEETMADRYFDHVVRACSQFGDAITERDLRRAVSVAVARCQQEPAHG